MSKVSAFLRHAAARIFRPAVAVLALLYFLIDALVYWVVRPFARWIGSLPAFAGLAAWVGGLGRYPSLVLVLLPLALLEPAKPAAAWLLATGRPWSGLAVLAGAELIKITLVERLFHLTRAKLMTIPWFAWLFLRAERWLGRLKALPPWQAVLRGVGRVKRAARVVTAMVRGWG